MGISLETAQAHLNKWLEADLKVANGQRYEIDGMSLTQTDADLITQKINYWQSIVNRLLSGRRGKRVMRIVPRDL